MKHIILAIALFGFSTVSIADKNVTLPTLTFQCKGGFTFAFAQTTSNLVSYQVIGEDGKPDLCGKRAKSSTSKIAEYDAAVAAFLNKLQQTRKSK